MFETKQKFETNQKFLLMRDLQNKRKGGGLLELFKSSSSLSKSIQFTQKMSSSYNSEIDNTNDKFDKKITLHKPSQSVSINKSILSSTANAMINLKDDKLYKETTIVKNLSKYNLLI